MKGFIVMCLVACAFAAPQYNYQPGGGNQGGFQSSSGFSSGGSSLGGGFSSGSLGSTGFGGSGAGLSLGGGGGGGGSVGGGFSSGLQTVANFGGRHQSGGGAGFSSGFSSGSSSFGQAQQPAIVSKQFYIHSAPEENDDDGISKTVSLGPAHKHYRVVFIKAPHASAKSSSVRFSAPQNEEKTVIYVLSKKTDAADIQTNIDAAHSAPSKPEVFFIKYKTPEEAAHAQKQIQAQYDALGGSSQISDEGVAPLTSVIGALGGGGDQGGGAGFIGGGGIGVGGGSSSGSHSGHFSSQSSGSGSGVGAVNGYLPPNH